MEGMLLVIKPAGMTSHDVVDWVRRWSGTRRVGHTGTLDPMAEGLLPVVLGRATRLSEYMLDVAKTYRAELVFGARTTTDDAWGKVISGPVGDDVDTDLLQEVLREFVGTQLQTPPMTSARRHGGERLYKLAREGKDVVREPREITVHKLELLKFEAASQTRAPRALLEVICSKGTYVRTLCADIGRKVGPGAYMSYLLRTAVGPHVVSDAHTFGELSELAAGQREAALLGLGAITPWMPLLRLEEEDAIGVRHGRPPERPLLSPEILASCIETPSPCYVRIVGPDGAFLAIGEVTRTGERPERPAVTLRKVFAT